MAHTIPLFFPLLISSLKERTPLWLSALMFLHENLEVKKKTIIFAAEKQYLKKMKRDPQEYIDIIRNHSAELHDQFGITSMRLFGSVARNEHHEGSDVDLFVKMPPKFFNHILASQYLEQLLGCTVDLIQDHKSLRPFSGNK